MFSDIGVKVLWGGGGGGMQAPPGYMSPDLHKLICIISIETELTILSI